MVEEEDPPALPSRAASFDMVVKKIGAAVRVVETPEFYIDEYAGNVGTKDDQLSIAVVRVAEPTAEVSLPPGALTLRRSHDSQHSPLRPSPAVAVADAALRRVDLCGQGAS